MTKKYKHIVIGFLAGALLFSAIPVGAEVATKIEEYICYKADYKVNINGLEYEDNHLPVLNYKGFTYIPLNNTLKNLGINYDISTNQRDIDISKGVPTLPYKKITFLGMSGLNVDNDVYISLSSLVENKEKIINMLGGILNIPTPTSSPSSNKSSTQNSIVYPTILQNDVSKTYNGEGFSFTLNKLELKNTNSLFCIFDIKNTTGKAANKLAILEVQYYLTTRKNIISEAIFLEDMKNYDSTNKSDKRNSIKESITLPARIGLSHISNSYKVILKDYTTKEQLFEWVVSE